MAIDRVLNVVINPLKDVGAVSDDLRNMLLVSVALIGLYVIFAYAGKRKMDREISSSRATVPSGIYIPRLVTPEYTKSIEMVLLR